MSSTNSSSNSSKVIDSLCFHMQLLTIPYSRSFMKSAPVKTDRDNGSFIIISLTECQEALSERQFGKQKHDTYFCLELTFAHKALDKALVLIPICIGDFNDFLQDISIDKKLNHSVLSCSEGECLWRLLCSLHPKTQHRTTQPIWRWHIYLAATASNQWWQWREQRENLKQFVLRDCLWFFLDYKNN